jgi:hypothetical protein
MVSYKCRNQGKASGSFLKKRTKKLFPVRSVTAGEEHPGRRSCGRESLFASFSSEKEESFLQATAALTRSANTLRNFITFGATTARQYPLHGLRAK